VSLLQEADAIFINNLKKHNLYDKVWQAGVILLPVQSVGVMGDERTYEQAVALRSVNSTDGMTAEWSHLPYEFLGTVSSEIINNVKGINRVVYDISTNHRQLLSGSKLMTFFVSSCSAPVVSCSKKHRMPPA
jgi:GMP synthase (glutamine-hydrolysing)